MILIRCGLWRYFHAEEGLPPLEEVRPGIWPYSPLHMHIADGLQHLLRDALLPKKIVWGFKGASPETAVFVLGSYDKDSCFVAHQGTKLSREIEALAIETLRQKLPPTNGHGPAYEYRITPTVPLEVVPLNLNVMYADMRNPILIGSMGRPKNWSGHNEILALYPER